MIILFINGVLEMNKAERCLKILEILQKNGSVKVKELMDMFDTSDMTIRRDLGFLSKQYNIVRTHGGAMLNRDDRQVVKLTSFDEEKIRNKEEKHNIAAKAVKLIKPGQRIFIDAGSTTRQIINCMTDDFHNVIVTNNLKVAESALILKNLSVVLLGGNMIRIANSTSGPFAEEQIKHYQLDIAFLGAAAVGSDGYIYDGYSPEAELKKSIFEVANEIYLLVDSSKFNTYDLHTFASLDQIKSVITDSNINKDGLLLLKKHHVSVIIAEDGE